MEFHNCEYQGYEESDLPTCPTNGCKGPVQAISANGVHIDEVVCTGCGVVIKDRPIAFFADEQRNFQEDTIDTRRTSAIPACTGAFESLDEPPGPPDSKRAPSHSQRMYDQVNTSLDLLSDALLAPPALVPTAKPVLRLLFASSCETRQCDSVTGLSPAANDATEGCNQFDCAAAVAAAACIMSCRKLQLPRYSFEIYRVQAAPRRAVQNLAELLEILLAEAPPEIPRSAFVQRFAEHGRLESVEIAAVRRAAEVWDGVPGLFRTTPETLAALGVFVAFTARKKKRGEDRWIKMNCEKQLGFPFALVRGALTQERRVLFKSYEEAFRAESASARKEMARNVGTVGETTAGKDASTSHDGSQGTALYGEKEKRNGSARACVQQEVCMDVRKRVQLARPDSGVEERTVRGKKRARASEDSDGLAQYQQRHHGQHFDTKRVRYTSRSGLEKFFKM